jgi:hypothetical protein
MTQLKMFENPLVKKCIKCGYVSSAPVKDFYKQNSNKDKLSKICKKCDSARGAIWRENNADKKLNTEKIYRNKKMPFLLENYNSKWQKYKKTIKKNLPDEILKRYQIYYTKEMFFEMVEEYEKKNGFVCEMTGVSLTTKRYLKNSKEFSRTLTNFSMDRLDPDIGYTKQNTVFVSWEFNNRKGAVTPKDCFLILKKYKERFHNEFNEFMKEFGEVFK